MTVGPRRAGPPRAGPPRAGPLRPGLLERGSHQIGLARALAGEVVAVQAAAASVRLAPRTASVARSSSAARPSGRCSASRCAATRGAGSSTSPHSTKWSALPAIPLTQSAKAAFGQLTRQIAVEYGPDGIICNAVAPGKVVTGTPGDLSQEEGTATYVKSRTPFLRLGEPRDVAAAVAFLASDDASFISGAQLMVDGGWMSYGGNWPTPGLTFGPGSSN